MSCPFRIENLMYPMFVKAINCPFRIEFDVPNVRQGDQLPCRIKFVVPNVRQGDQLPNLQNLSIHMSSRHRNLKVID
jgi:hypothetical protein